MKSVVTLWEACLTEAGLQHCVRTNRDLAYARSRMEHQGLAFLTIVLPTFEKDLLVALSQGFVGSNLFRGFKRRGGLPAFLSDFLRRVFHGSTGQLLPDADYRVVRSIRQILLLASKIELPTTPARELDAITAYVRTDAGLEDIDPSLLSEFSTVARSLLGSYLQDVEFRLYSGDWTPRHSSGALATRESYNSRYNLNTWTERLNAVFPYWEDLYVSHREIMDRVDQLSILARDEEPPCRMALVPKTMKGPRVIAMEPSWMQFVQQGIFHVMSDCLDSYEVLSSYFGWLNQEPNRLLAKEGSISGGFATLDLSEASDRVSLQLVESLLACTPFLRKCILAARSESVLLPSGKVHRLNKFASMGSSLCFPIESMVFFIIEAMAWGRNAGIAPVALRIRDLPRMRVYGDDMIVPTPAAQTLTQLLEAFGLKVNARKSFTAGLFRESCGSDWFKGGDVSVFKLRSPLPESMHQPDLLDRAIQFHNRCYSAGWFWTARAVEIQLSKLVRQLPYAPVGSPVSALWSYDQPPSVRVSRTLQRIEMKTFVFRQVKPVDPLDGWGALKKFYYPHSDVRSREHLQRDGRSRYAGVHIGWVVVPE